MIDTHVRARLLTRTPHTYKCPKEQDNDLLLLVEQFGTKCWRDIASRLCHPPRQWNECRDRYWSLKLQSGEGGNFHQQIRV